jgi:GAF domain-containing protein
MADQLANAIQNARLLEQSQVALREMAATQRRYEQRAWADYLKSVETTHYEVTASGVTATSVFDKTIIPEIQQAMVQEGVQVLRGDASDASHSALVAPITQRGGAVIGALGIHADEGREWTEDEIALVEAVVERMGMTAETLRLLDETQRSAARERAIADATGRVRESLELEDVLRSAATQIREAMGLNKIVVRLATPERLADESQEGQA